MTRNKLSQLNKHIQVAYADIYEDWMADENQKKVKKILKNKREKVEKTGDRKHTPYIQYCIKERPTMKLQNPDANAKEITALLGKMWNEMKISDPAYLEDNFGYKPPNKIE